ncbi:Glycoside hydrolase [Cinnamomum micranthum f. kanehirae]|uniref:Glycoside hydrolase n=1 Tax=Cinnamomum micranthum f. kanehirae TaxID=337451 RepID=A0A443NVB5_9MAGN|nr:Glycoside hydrolase [Cinnamomum micranthum f. kanehirae]
MKNLLNPDKSYWDQILGHYPPASPLVPTFGSHPLTDRLSPNLQAAERQASSRTHYSLGHVKSLPRPYTRYVKFLPGDLFFFLQCLAEPLKPQYGGGILLNSEFNNGLRGWSKFGPGKIEQRVSKGGNKFIVAHSRKEPYDSFSQKLYMKKELLYTFSAWIQVSEGKAPVSAVFKTASGFMYAGTVHARPSKNIGVEIWVDSVSLQPFTQEQWRSHQDESIEKARKTRVRFRAANPDGTSLAGATVSISIKKASFPFGCAITSSILKNVAYQNWFSSRFSVTVFQNEMKWYSTEVMQGKEDYSVADAMVAFAKKNGIPIRGHNILWDDPHYQLNWINSLRQDQLRAAVQKRVNSIVTRYQGQVIGWDVVNENMHFNFFERWLGANTSTEVFQTAHNLDPNTPMFINEYNTIEDSRDPTVTPDNYLAKLREVQNQGPTAIGLEGHFHTPNIPYMRASIDKLATAKLPIWLTEVDVDRGPDQATFLEKILREGHAHPAVQGMLMWAGWEPNESNYRMRLTDNNFKNLPTGDVVDRLINEWKPANIAGATNKDGFFEVSLFHGDYDVTVSHPLRNSSMTTHSLKVVPQTVNENTFHVEIQA